MSGHVRVRSYRIDGTDEENEEVLDKIQRDPFIRDNDIMAYIANISGRNAGPSIQLMYDESKSVNEATAEDADCCECDFPAWALDYAVNAELGSVSRAEKSQVDAWFDAMSRLGYDTGCVEYGEDEFFSNDPEFGLPCDCVTAKLRKVSTGAVNEAEFDPVAKYLVF